MSVEIRDELGEKFVFDEITIVDAEYHQPKGERVLDPICIVAFCLGSGRTYRLDLQREPIPEECPWPTDHRAPNVFFMGTGDLQIYRHCGWKEPKVVFDLFAEFLNFRNGRRSKGGPPPSLLAACEFFHIPVMSSGDKDAKRSPAVRGGPFTNQELDDLLVYCEEDVLATARLFLKLVKVTRVPHMITRGRYMKAVSGMEWRGLKIDVPLYTRVTENWKEIVLRAGDDLVDEPGLLRNGRINPKILAQVLGPERLNFWPRRKNGLPQASREVISDMAKRYPDLKPLGQAARALSTLIEAKFDIGHDGRNRSRFRVFETVTSRTTVSGNRAPWGLPRWWRGMIVAPEDRAILATDVDREEFGVAAALSGDEKMQAAYQAGDTYMAVAHQLGLAPADATAETHPEVRKISKRVTLGMIYGAGPERIAHETGLPLDEATKIHRKFRQNFETYTAWGQNAAIFARRAGRTRSLLGWDRWTTRTENLRSLANHPMQVTGGDLMRMVCIRAHEEGLELVGTVHDSFVLECQPDQAQHTQERIETLISECSQKLLRGFALKATTKILMPGERLMEAQKDWDLVMRKLEEVETRRKLTMTQLDLPTEERGVGANP